MTAETSNARGEVVAWFPTNGRGEIIRTYGDGSPVYACRTKEEAEQAKRCHLGATGPVIPLYTAPPSAPVAADWITGDGLQGIKAEAHFLTQHKEEAVQRAGKRLLDRADKIIAALYQPPSAPVGVEWPLSLLRAGHWREVYIGHRCMRLEVTYDYATWERLMAEVESALAPPPADAEPKTLPVPTHVYLTDKAAVIVGDPQRGWDEEGPEAHNCDDMGCAAIGPHVLARVPFTDERALSQQPEARGVVDEGSRIVTSQLLHWGGIPVRVTGTVTTSPGNWPLIDATQHQEPKS